LKKRELKTVFIEYDAVEELPSEDKKLIVMAKKAAETAYAPYSEFHVGAAVLLENGVCIKGNNQENVAYPSGLCAERVAVFAASSQYPGIAIKAIVISAKSMKFTVSSPVTPCGACRQVLAEYEHLQKQPIRIILSGEEGKVFVIDKVEDLLPLSFKADKLKK
jgi:cytidine deaminase